MKKRICVIDGQGGIGATLIKCLKNAIATSQMLKVGANRGASGENAIVRTLKEVDLIIGPVAITWANAMLGEVTSRMAEAVASSLATKILIPLTQENVILVGVLPEPLPHLIKTIIEKKIIFEKPA